MTQQPAQQNPIQKQVNSIHEEIASEVFKLIDTNKLSINSANKESVTSGSCFPTNKKEIEDEISAMHVPLKTEENSKDQCNRNSIFNELRVSELILDN